MSRSVLRPTCWCSGDPQTVCWIVPEHMLQAIALNHPEADVRARALDSLSLSHSLTVARVGYDESQRPLRQQLREQRLFGGGGLLAAAAAGPSLEDRTIYNANDRQRLPGDPVRFEGEGATGDPAVDEAYDYMGDTYDFYLEVFGRNSVDDAGYPLNGSVHYSKNYDNAFWDGQRMIYGDGDGRQFERFTKAVDVIGHELTHGVTQNEAGLIYWGQTGALNESISDVFGSLVRQWTYNQTADQADWLIGEGLFTPSVQGVAIRSLAAPGSAYDDPVLGKDPQPDHMSRYVRTMQDNGGVHINSGIPNKAFYLAATGLGGFAWEVAGDIWYEALCSPLLTKLAAFSQFARLTVAIAQERYSSAEGQIVANAWASVGVNV